MRRLFASVLVVALAAACSDSTSVEDVAGNYTLVSANNASLPATILEVGTTKAEIVSGSANLNANGSYTASLTARLTDGGNVSNETLSDTGTWTLSGSTVTLTSDESENDTLAGTVNGNRITITTDIEGIAVTLVFEK